MVGSKAALLCCTAMLFAVTSAARLRGNVTSLGTFNAALLPQYPEVEQRVNLLTELVRPFTTNALVVFLPS
jgi:hypothetical protein